jgi:uncharacterized membrane protein
MIALYVGVFSVWSLKLHDAYLTVGFDLGIFDQGIWLLSRFKEPYVTVRGLNLFGDHTSFILVFLGPLYWIFPSSSALLVVQAAAIGVGAVPAFLIAREKLRSEVLACLVALLYLVHPVTGWTNLDRFHPDSFELPLVLVALYFMLRERWTAFVLAVLGTLLVKEDVPLLTFALGIYVAFRFNRRVGFAVAALSVVWAVASLWLIIPAFNGGAGSTHSWRIVDQFGGWSGFITTAFTRPWHLVAQAFGSEGRWYLWQLVAPLALLPVLSPAVLITAAGPILSNLLSALPYQRQIHYHYSTLILPILVTSTVMGIARFRSHQVRRGLVALVLVSTLISTFVWGPIGKIRQLWPRPLKEYVVSVDRAMQDIPPDASVSAFSTFVPHLSHREHIYEFPNPWIARYWGAYRLEGKRLPAADSVRYLMVPANLKGPERDLVQELRTKEGFRAIYADPSVVVLERAPA